MLLSEREERGRRFKIALRAGIPIVLLISLVFYSTFLQNEKLVITPEEGLLMAGLLFISVYFIYFLVDLSAQETLVDQATQGFNEKAFLSELQSYKPNTLVLLVIKNLSIIHENYSISDVDLLLYTLIHKIDHELSKTGLGNALIARRYGGEFLIAIKKKEESTEEIIENFIETYSRINGIELDYEFSILNNIDKAEAEDIDHLKDIIKTERKNDTTGIKKQTVQDAKVVSKLERSIIDALQKKQLKLTFRPLESTHTGKIEIYEISAKLDSDEAGEILPRHYLPVINRLGLGREYDLSLFSHLLALLPLIDDTISVSFNLSPFSLRDETFQKKFFALLEQSSIDPSRLIIELYERKTHHNLGGYLQTLNKFRAKGLRIAIDNFGSSNASMEYMKHFNFDIVQFDRDYVSKLEDKITFTMFESMVKMSKDLHITTVAKWVDNTKQKERLKALEIDYLQGFGIAKPISEQTLIDRYN